MGSSTNYSYDQESIEDERDDDGPPKRARMSDARLVAIVAIAITAISSCLAFFSPNWLASERRFYGAVFVKLGLWETCFRSFVSPFDLEMVKYYAGCRWIFADEYQNIRHLLMPGNQRSLLNEICLTTLTALQSFQCLM